MQMIGDGRFNAALLLLLALGTLYVACRAMIGALALEGESGSGRAVAQWLPVAATALAAVALRHHEIAVAVILGTSVAYLSLVLGMTTYVSPLPGGARAPRGWAFVVPAALLCLMVGLHGAISWVYAIMFLLLGLAVFAVWQEDLKADETEDSPTIPLTAGRGLDWRRRAQFILATMLAAAGGWGAVVGAVATSRRAQVAGPVLIAVSVLSPMLVLPSLRSCTALAQEGKTALAARSVIGTVLLNLCLLLPLSVLGWYTVPGRVAATQPSGADATPGVNGMPFPVYIWGLEIVVLLILGVLLLPISLGRWTLSKQESTMLVFAYVLYMAALAFGG